MLHQGVPSLFIFAPFLSVPAARGLRGTSDQATLRLGGGFRFWRPDARNIGFRVTCFFPPPTGPIERKDFGLGLVDNTYLYLSTTVGDAFPITIRLLSNLILFFSFLLPTVVFFSIGGSFEKT